MGRILVSWIGHADWGGFASALPEAERKPFLESLGARPKSSSNEWGPIRTLLEYEKFDAVHLLADASRSKTKRFARWLACSPKIHQVTVENPIDYSEIFRISNGVLSKITADTKTGDSLNILLSPGTPAMTAIWVLLGKTRYPAKFYQTHKRKVIDTEIPFDLIVDFVPEFLKDPDRNLAALAAEAPHEIIGFEDITGNSKAIRVAVGRAKRTAIRDVSVLLLGESGVGKELFARAMHNASPSRRSEPFVAVNCAAMPRELLDSELFGHVKDSFTGAKSDHHGAFKQADHGTLFLDEVGECDIAMQAKLLRVLQSNPRESQTLRTFRRVGDEAESQADVRIIAATNKDLLAEVSAGRFREDLYYRLAMISLKIPSLRERATDLPDLIEFWMIQINSDFDSTERGYKHKRISPHAKRVLLTHPWPGNVRELRNVLIQAAVMADSETIGKADVEAAMSDTPAAQCATGANHPLGDGFDLSSHIDEIERAYIARAMEDSNGVKTKAAKLLGLKSYQALDAKLKRLDVQ